MRHVIGITPNEQEYLWPLESEDRIRFDTDNFHSLGYFDLFAPHFERFAQRDSQIGIESMNVLFVLDDSDLKEVLVFLSELEGNLAKYPHSWRTYLGEVHPPRKAPIIRIEPLLFRHRAIGIVNILQKLVIKALDQGKRLVYGNGVLYRHLCGIKLPPGTVEYS